MNILAYINKYGCIDFKNSLSSYCIIYLVVKVIFEDMVESKLLLKEEVHPLGNWQFDLVVAELQKSRNLWLTERLFKNISTGRND